ncbi:MAG: hypothetical protein E3K37_00625 [Candidatus Kuenenia sp.]|nr:hypothetical protein [Candidatus Kuenenia hertensis]
MFTYQIRPRVFRLEEGTTFTFPAKGKVKFVFQPLQTFGVEAGGGRTAVKAVAATVLFDANTGQHTIESKDPLKPLEVILEEPNRNVCLQGNVLTIEQDFKSNEELTHLIQGVYFGLPSLLNVEYADPPVIERVDGEIGNTPFRWELAGWYSEFRTTTQEKQELAFVSSWKRIGLLSVPTNTRLLAALHFYYVAVRLLRRAVIAGEFLPEAILNFSKVLEVLFPPDGDGKSRDSARKGLEKLGFAELEIEADYIPAMALRNEIGVGHVDLGLFKPEHLTLIHGYVRRAEFSFHTLLQRLFEKIKSNEFEVVPYERKPIEGSALAVVKKLNEFKERYEL